MSDTESSKGGKVVAIVIGVIAIVGLGAGGWIWFASSNPSTETRDHRIDEPVDRLELVGSSGDVSVTVGDEVTVREKLRWLGDKPEPQRTVEDGTVRLSSDGCDNRGPFWGCEVHYEITLPADTEIDIETSSGDVSVSGVSGTQDITVSSGDLTVSEPTGDLELHTTSGDITVSDMTVDRLVAKVDSGDMDLSGTATTADLTASSGSIGATSFTGDDVSADLSSGDLNVSFANAPTHVDVTASSGTVELTMPDDATAYRVEVTVGSGDKNIGVTEGGSEHTITADVASGDFTIRYS